MVQTQCAWASHHPQPFWSPYVEEKAPILTKLSIYHFLEKGLIWSHLVLPYRVTRDFRRRVLSRCSPPLYSRTSLTWSPFVSFGASVSWLPLRLISCSLPPVQGAPIAKSPFVSFRASQLGLLKSHLVLSPPYARSPPFSRPSRKSRLVL